MDTTGLRKAARVCLLATVVLAVGTPVAATPAPGGAAEPETAPSWKQGPGSWLSDLAGELWGALRTIPGVETREAPGLDVAPGRDTKGEPRSAGDDLSPDPQRGMDADPDG